MMSDSAGYTALCCVYDGHVTSLLLESLPPYLQQKLLLKRDKQEATALHHVCHPNTYRDFPQIHGNSARDDAVKVLVNCAGRMKPETILLLLVPDVYGNTVLDTACRSDYSSNAAELILDLVQRSLSQIFCLSNFILFTNKANKSVLHNTMNEDTATLLVKSLESGADKLKLVTHIDKDGRNILHMAIRGSSLSVKYDRVRRWILPFIDKIMSKNDVPGDTLHKMRHHTDDNGDTPIITALSRVALCENDHTQDAYQFIVDLLEFLCSRTDFEDTLRSVLEQRNIKDQTVFHLAALLPVYRRVPVLEKLVEGADTVEYTSCSHSYYWLWKAWFTPNFPES